MCAPPNPTLEVRYNTSLLITDGYWKIGDEPEDDTGGIRSVVTGLASPLMGAESGWQYYDDEWQTDKLLSVKGIIMMTHN